MTAIPLAPRDDRGRLVLTLARGRTALLLETSDGPVEIKLRRIRFGATTETNRASVVVVAPKSVQIRRTDDDLGGER